MNKVVRIYLISEHKDKNGAIVSYQDINKLLWELQKQTRTIKNKTIQYCWEYQNFSSDYYKEHHAYPSLIHWTDMLMISSKIIMIYILRIVRLRQGTLSRSSKMQKQI